MIDEYAIHANGLADPLYPKGVRELAMVTGWVGMPLSMEMLSEKKRIHVGMSQSKADLLAGGICSVTGATAPGSRLITVNGKRVLDIAPYKPARNKRWR